MQPFCRQSPTVCAWGRSGWMRGAAPLFHAVEKTGVPICPPQPRKYPPPPPPPPVSALGRKTLSSRKADAPELGVLQSISAPSLTLLFIPGLGAFMESSQPHFWVNYFIISFFNWIANSTVWIEGCALAHPSPAARNKKLWMLRIAVEKPTFNAGPVLGPRFPQVLQ